MLADEERAALETWDREGVYACPHEGDRCPTPEICRNEYGLFAEVESIVTARVRAARAQELRDAADGIQALHPGEVKNSVLWLRDRANHIESSQTT